MSISKSEPFPSPRSKIPSTAMPRKVRSSASRASSTVRPGKYALSHFVRILIDSFLSHSWKCVFLLLLSCYPVEPDGLLQHASAIAVLPTVPANTPRPSRRSIPASHGAYTDKQNCRSINRCGYPRYFCNYQKKGRRTSARDALMNPLAVRSRFSSASQTSCLSIALNQRQQPG